ncbi:hypothetical protein OROMI_033132 [Orobanche minor]
MPPKTTKRGAAASGAKRGGRAPRGTSKAAQNQQQQPEPVEEKAVIEEPKVEENPVIDGKTREEAKTVKKDEDEIESIDEYEKDERLDLEDHDPEYEPEEYGGVDYDEKEIEQEEGHEVGDEVEEEVEDNVGEEGDSGEEEVEDGHDEIECEEDDEHADEEHEHAEMADVEEEEHRGVVKERRKRKEFEVFVGGLDKDATQDDLRKVFGEVGIVTEVRLMMNPQTKKNKGFALLRFENMEQAKRAVEELKNPVINRKQCGVTPSQDSDTLYFGNICKIWTKEAEKLKHYGVTNVEDITLVEDSNDKGTNRGFAFLEFSSRSDAMDAFKRLQKRDVVFGVDKPAKVSFADSFIDPGDEIMLKLYLSMHFLLHGMKITAVVFSRNMAKLKRLSLLGTCELPVGKDYGFVTFGSHDAAIRCAESITGTELGEGEKKTKVRARLSRPLQRGRGKHVGRGDYRPGRGPPRGLFGADLHPVVFLRVGQEESEVVLCRQSGLLVLEIDVLSCIFSSKVVVDHRQTYALRISKGQIYRTTDFHMQIKCYMQQILRGLEHCHSRGILHRDIKGANILVDRKGNLKIADFGLATITNPNKKHLLTSRVVTLWYRAPELLLGATDYEAAIDLWSVGCIIAELFHGKPIMPGRTEVCGTNTQDIQAVWLTTEAFWKKTKLPLASSFRSQRVYKRSLSQTFKDFPSSALALLEVLLSIDPQERGTASSALRSGFFTSKPLPCDPSKLPRYPSSKELEARIRRQRGVSVKGGKGDNASKISSKQRAIPDGQGQPNTGMHYQTDSGNRFPIVPPRVRNGCTHQSKSVIHPNAVAVGYSWNKKINGDPFIQFMASAKFLQSNQDKALNYVNL